VERFLSVSIFFFFIFFFFVGACSPDRYRSFACDDFPRVTVSCFFVSRFFVFLSRFFFPLTTKLGSSISITMMQVSSHRTLGSQHISLDEKNNQMMTTVARAKVEAEIRQLMDSGSITLSLNSLLHDFDQRNQRCAFLKFCEMMMSADLVKCYLLIRDDYWNSLDDTLICDSIVRRIRTFFSNGSPNFLLSDETLNDKVLVDSTPELFDKVANEILKIRQKQLFENFLCYLANNKLAANLPSFQTCLTEGSATGEMFLNFCRTLRCEEILLFWREATAFEENVGSDFETYHEAIAIYDQYLAPNAASFFGADGHKVFAELEKGKSDRSMFRSIKKEAEQVLGQDLWPNFISNG
jgi:hypothetical protein